MVVSVPHDAALVADPLLAVPGTCALLGACALTPGSLPGVCDGDTGVLDCRMEEEEYLTTGELG